MPVTRCLQRAVLFKRHRAATDAYSDMVKLLRGALGADYKLAHERSELARQFQSPHPEIDRALCRLMERDVAERSRFHKAESWQAKPERGR